ncbi:hypothetical protein PHAVU_003G129000 [Phaseolus vulgaris]|uniref:FLZ-type domain-containing protein n=1 Tax=Phaseolus vulgaris TaxID=3885 RepID=V7C8T2_PHAVU|nr:hypothetical protein PHAVU_003G129000g [Phaseolus vulgaris]ESW26554.1 hypothetical protein PHAVU_003G129000g [Phaseolus vulgaris]
MLGKRPRPMIGKLSELLVSRGRPVTLPDAAAAAPTASPRGPLGIMMQSPRGLKNYHLGGVGLGIVVALDKSSNDLTHEVLPKHAVCTSNLKIQDEFDVEEYTYVTRHVPNKTLTKVYYNGAEGEIQRHDYHYSNTNNNTNTNNLGVFRRTAPQPLFESEPSYPTSNFLSSCNLCGKKLHGKDIYMYRGEKAFCSPECRSNQIMMDERKERCRSEASRSVEMSSSPYTREHIFSTGILVL